jgi:hypothetical protein
MTYETKIAFDSLDWVEFFITPTTYRIGFLTGIKQHGGVRTFLCLHFVHNHLKLHFSASGS